MRKLWIGLTLWISLWSCQPGNSNQPGNEGSAFFPLKEYVEVQAEKLNGKTIRKRLIINGEQEEVEVVRSEEDWIQELDFFLDADINTKALSQSYDSQRSQEYLIHTLKEGENGRIKKIVVQYNEDKVKAISFHALTDNLIYSSETRGVIYTHSETGLLDHYIVENTQEVILLKPNKLIIYGSVIN
jgi:hypothetical protein